VNVYLPAAAAAATATAQSAAEPQVEVSRTADVEEGDVAEAPAVNVEMSGDELTAAGPATRLLSPPAADKPLPTANGPTSRVVTRPRLSRTLDLSTASGARVDTTDSKLASSAETSARSTTCADIAAVPVADSSITSNVSQAYTVR